MALQSTPRVTCQHLVGLEFGPLRAGLPLGARGPRSGAQIVMVASHIEPETLLTLADDVQDLGITYFGGGHTHRSLVATAGGAQVAAASSHWQDYVITHLRYDPASGQTVVQSSELVTAKYDPAQVTPEPTTAAIIATWEKRSEAALGEVIGYVSKPLRSDSPGLQNLLVDSWLWAYDGAEIAISNSGGFRQDLPAGDITLGSMGSVLPFDNVLYEIQMTGSQVQAAISGWRGDLVYGGLRRGSDGQVLLASTGEPLDPEATYRVLVTDYLYGNAKYPFSGDDPEPYETGISWRQPAIDWIRVQHSNSEHPLEEMLDTEARF